MNYSRPALPGAIFITGNVEEVFPDCPGVVVLTDNQLHVPDMLPWNGFVYVHRKGDLRQIKGRSYCVFRLPDGGNGGMMG